MPASKTEIVNIALIELGERPVANIDTGTDAASKNATRIYDAALDEVLAAHEWDEATRRQALSLLTDVPAFGYARAFQLPSDFIRLTRASDLSVNYTIEDNRMLTDETTLSIVYIFRQTNIARYSPGFVQALAMNLAARLAMSLRADRALKRDMEAKFARALNDASYQDATQQPLRQLQPSSWIESRDTGRTDVRYSDWNPR